MGFLESIKDFYFKLEDKYYDFLDWVEDKGIPIYKVVDAVEASNIPSFPILLILLLLIAGIAIFSVATFFPTNATMTVNVIGDNGKAVDGAIVSIQYANTAATTKATDTQGKATFTVILGSKITGTVTKTNYKEQKIDAIADKKEFSKDITLPLSITVFTRTIQLLDKSTGALLKKEVGLMFTCSENANYNREKITSNGMVTLDDIPNDCGKLIATSTSGFTIDSGDIDLVQSAPQLKLAEQIVEKGKLKVFLKNAQGNPAAGVTVKLISAKDSMQKDSKPSSTAGSAEFADVAVGKYYIRTYDGYNNKYAEYDSSVDATGIKEVNKDETTEFTIVLQEKILGRIKVLVKDKGTGLPIPNVSLTLFRDGIALKTVSTNAEGKEEFAASETSGYSIKADHQSYLIETKTGLSPSDTTIEIQLTKATSSNIQSLIVSVVDTKGQAVENTRLVLKKLDGSVVSDTIATGLDGNAEFERIQPDSYYVYAVKDGFEGVSSSPITIAERQQNNLQIILPIASGTIEVSVIDEDTKPAQGATIRMLDAFTMKEIQRETTGTDGKKSFNVRADKKVFFKASADGMLDYTTMPIAPIAGDTLTKEIKLSKEITKIEIDFLGLFVDKESADQSLAAGQKYTAKLQLKIPTGTTYSEAGIHLRTGKSIDGKTNTMEADSLFISKVFASANTITKGTTYTPPIGYATDQKQLTSGNAKWANLVFKQPTPGVYEIEAEIIVKENAQIGSTLDIDYRGWAKATTISRYPIDKTLNENETVGERQALYANTLKELFSVGPNNLCNESFCYSFTIEDLDVDLITQITDSYEAKISGNYKLLFTIVSKEEAMFPASELVASNDSAGLKLGAYTITGADGKKNSGTATGSVSLAVGDIRKNSSMQGEVSFKTTKEGINKLQLVIKSQKENVFNKGIDVSVSAASEMTMDVLPKVIIPFLDNDIILHFTDSKTQAALEGVAVSVFLDNTSILQTETDSSGVAHFTIQKPSAGSTIRIEATKNGYKPITMEKKISQNILTVTPEQVNEILTVTGTPSLERDIHLTNNTTMRLRITSLGTSTDFQGLVKFSWKENYIGTEVTKDTDKNIFLKIELTDAGKRVEEITKLEGALTIVVTSSENANSWAINIPLTIRIGFGKEVDDATCLTIDPVDWPAITGKRKAEQKFAIKNNCTVGKTPIALKTIQIKIDQGKESAFGTFVATSTLPNSNTVKLSTAYAVLSPAIGANAEETITISFEPDSNVMGGEATPKILIKAINPTESGPEEVISKISVTLKISDLAQCIELKRTKNLTIYNCPQNTGYGIYNQYGYGGYGYLGAQANRFGDTSFAGYPEQMNAMHYPYSGFSQPFYDSSYISQQNINNYNCGTTSFSIANNCSSTVQIDIDPDPALQTDKTTMDLASNEEKAISVQASYFVGTYPIGVRAKVKESKEKSTEVSTVYVNVQLMDDPSTYNDCIKLNSTSFKFNDFIQKPVTAKVYNTCYAQGVRLDYDSVRFSQSAYGEKYPRTEGTSGGTTGSGMGLIQNVEVIDLSTKKESNNKITQTLEFEITKNIDYRRQEGFPRSGTPFAQIGNMRAFATGAYFRVEAPAIIIVNYTSSIGGQQSKRFHVTIEDYWNLLGTLEALDLYGCPNIPAQACILGGTQGEKPALDFGISSNECMDEKFGTDNIYTETRDVFRVGECKNPKTDKECGTSDKLALDEGSTRIEQDGVIVTFSVGQSKNPSFLGIGGPTNAVTVTIDRSKAKMYGEIKIDKKLFGTITRTTPMGAQRIEMPFKVCVVSHTGGLKTEKLDQCAKEVESAIKSSSEQLSEPLIQAIIDKTPNCKSLSDDEKKQITKFLMDKLGRVPTATTKCEQGKTGTEAAALGLGRLPFSWQFDETKAATKAITKTTCDEGAGNKYCDATQFTIELVKKSVDIQDKISGWKNTMKTANSAIVRAVMQVPTSTKSLDAYENTKELYRWALKQVKIENKYYFEAANGILNKPIEADDTIKKQIEAVNQSSGQGAIDQMKTLLDTIASRPYNTDVFAEIEISTAADTKKLQAIDADTIKALGAIELKVNERYLMKFSAFKNLHEEIAKACAAAGTNCNDAATRITVSKTEISTAFLQKFLNSVSFKRGVMHTKDMDDATIDFVMNNAQPIDGINQLELKAVWAEIKSVSFLTTDNYTAKFIEDFEGYYKDPLKSTTAYNGFIMTHFNNKGFGFSGIKENAVTAGKYSVFINADFSKAKPDEYTYEIQLKNLAEPEGELKNNWFLYNSIDGQIGTANTRDYGMDSRNSDIVLVKDGDAATDAVTIIGKTTGTIVPYKWSVFSYIKNGKILEANGSKFEFTPSSAFKLELTSTSLASVTTLYDLANIAGASTPFINWIDNQEKAGLTCKSGGTTQYYGITTKPGTLKAPFFVPDSEFIDIILVCTDGASTLKATEIQVPSNISTSASSIDIDNRASNTKRIKLPSAAEARLHTVKDYLDAVNSEYVCIDSSNSSLALLWNKEKITK